MAGAPIRHNKKEIEQIIERFANGEKLPKLFKEYGIVRTTFLKKIEDYELENVYTCARHYHGDYFNDEIEDLKDKLLKGKIDQSSARVLIDTIKWQAAKFYPKMYGDKLDVTSENKAISSTPIVIQVDGKEIDLSK